MEFFLENMLKKIRQMILIWNSFFDILGFYTGRKEHKIHVEWDDCSVKTLTGEGLVVCKEWMNR